MAQYILKRLLVMIPTILGITLITFFVISMAPGDPIAAQAGGGAGATEGGASASQEKAALVIKAKKQLLGLLTKDAAVRVWGAGPDAVTPPNGEARLRLTGRAGEFQDWPHAIVQASDGTLYVGTENGTVASIDPASGGTTRTFGAHAKAVWAAALSADGRLLATGDTDGGIRVWSTADGAKLGEAAVGKTVRDLAFVGGGKLLVACEDGVIRVAETPSLKFVGELHDHTGSVAALATSPDGSRFYSGGFDRELREWDAAKLAVTRTLGTHRQAITDIAVSRDGKLAATASDDRVVRVFDLSGDPTAEPKQTEFAGHTKEVTAVAISPDGATVWSGSKDESIRGWDRATGELAVRTPEMVGRSFGLAVSNDGRSLYSASESWTKTPVWTRYLKWLGRTVTFDFGLSFTDERPVLQKIAEALPTTLALNFIAIIVIYVVSLPIGVRAAVRRGSAFDASSSIVLFLLNSIPSFWLGTMLITTLSSERKWNVLPSVGMHSMEADSLSYLPWLSDWGSHLVLPLVVLTYAGFAGLSRYVRTSMLETIAQDYIRTARAKGLSERVVNYRHALRNSLITIVTLVGTLLPGMIGGSVIVEQIFSIHGMGYVGFQAIQERDYPMVMAIATFSALLTLVGMLISDILYTVVDPRISHS